MDAVDGLPSIVELLRVLINILDPNDRLHTDSTRLTALRILNTAFEVAGSHISAYPSLMVLIQDRGCKFLFQLARSDNPYMLHMTLRVITTMFETMRSHLKLQQELFLAFMVDRLTPTVLSKAQLNALEQQRFGGSPRPGTPVPASPHPGTPDPEAEPENTNSHRPAVAPAKGEIRELMLETLHHLAQHPSFMVDLYVNYDCDINCEDLFDRLLDFLCKVGSDR
jgi:brefeldin A-resistance guanine nucleotide exchange factor 1